MTEGEGDILLYILLGLIPLALMVRRLYRLWRRQAPSNGHSPHAKPDPQLRPFRSLAFVWISVIVGFVVGKVFVPPVYLPFFAGLVLLFAILGAIGAYYLFWHNSRDSGAPLLAPDAEREARAHFLPCSDTADDDASIQFGKQGLKPGDR